MEQRAGEIAQQLRALAALPEDLGQFLALRQRFTTICELQFQGIQHHLLASLGNEHTHDAQTYTEVKHQ